MKITIFLLLVSISQGFSTNNPVKNSISSIHFKNEGSEHSWRREPRYFQRLQYSKDSSTNNPGKSLNNPITSPIIVQATTIPNSEVLKASASMRKDLTSNYELSPQQFIYVVLTSIFITCLIVADVVGVKLFEIPLPFEIFGHRTVEHTCGMLTFPITFILGDIINEYYGPKAAKNTVRSCYIHT